MIMSCTLHWARQKSYASLLKCHRSVVMSNVAITLTVAQVSYCRGHDRPPLPCPYTGQVSWGLLQPGTGHSKGHVGPDRGLSTGQLWPKLPSSLAETFRRLRSRQSHFLPKSPSVQAHSLFWGLLWLLPYSFFVFGDAPTHIACIANHLFLSASHYFGCLLNC